jgi:drug/metabolite transporter (DMT)-like permease
MSTSASPGRTSTNLPANIIAIQIGLCALWGLGQIMIKVAGSGISPFFHAGIRSLGAGLLVWLWIAYKRQPIPFGPGIRGPALLAGLLFSVEFMLLFPGLSLTTAARATLLLYSAPFFVAIGLHFFMPGERLTKTRVLGMGLAFVGVALAFGDRLGGFTKEGLLGDLMCLGAAACWGATTVVMKTTALKTVRAEVNLFYQLATSAVLLLAASFLINEPGLFNPSPTVLSLLAVQILIVASMSYMAWFYLVTHYNAAVLHTLTFLTPVFGMMFAWWLLDEPVGPMLVVALVLVAIGIVLVNRKPAGSH